MEVGMSIPYHSLSGEYKLICYIIAMTEIILSVLLIIMVEIKKTELITNFLKNKYVFFLASFYIVICGILTMAVFFEFSYNVYTTLTIGISGIPMFEYIFSKAFLFQLVVHYSSFYLIVLGLMGMIARKKSVYEQSPFQILKITSIPLLFTGLIVMVSLRFL
jgi:hypothetical protein